MEIISDTMTFEYKEYQDIFNTSSSIFKIFYELKNIKGKDDIANKFYQAFDKTMSESSVLC